MRRSVSVVCSEELEEGFTFDARAMRSVYVYWGKLTGATNIGRRPVQVNGAR